MIPSRIFSSVRQRLGGLSQLLQRPRLLGLIAGGLIALVVAGAGFVVVWEYTNSSTFCGTRCHTMPPEYAAYNQSMHARVSCVDCHIGRVGFFKSAVLKSGHGGHLTNLIFDSYERPIRIKTLRPARETCELCHWPEAFYEDRVRVIEHRASDEGNTLSSTYLIMRTGGGTSSQGQGKGIHWHIENKVEFIATDKDKQDIPYVRVTDSQGKVTEYTDVTANLSTGEVEKAPLHEMDCLDCHNRSAHLFRSPDQSLDEALGNGRIDPSLPFIKEKGLELLTAKHEDLAAAEVAIAGLADYYQQNYPQVAQAKKAAVEQAINTIADILRTTVFPNQSVGWSTYPNDEGHKDFPGCFRCHDGKHVNAQGESIRLQCNLCHSIPVVLGPGEAPKVQELGQQLLVPKEPPSHLASNFMADHRFQANDSCQTCHGAVTFGKDDSNFCSNSACHGTKWPQVQLDAGLKHPMPLEGKHAQTWCYQCHSGQRKPEPQCASCHPRPHDWGSDQCDQCHTFAAWKPLREGVAFPESAHTFPQDHGGANKDCSQCHPNQQDRSKFTCAKCHEASSDFMQKHRVDTVDTLTSRCALCHPLGKRP